MFNQDLANNVKVLKAYVGATISTATDTTSTTVIDAKGFEAVMFIATSATITDGDYTLKIFESDNADGTTGATEVGAYMFQGTFAAADDNSAKKVGAHLSKRYCTLRITSAGTTSGGVFGAAVAVLGGARNAPVGA